LRHSAAETALRNANRHRKAHLPAQLRAKLIAGPDIALDLERLRENESQSLLANLVALRHRLFASLDVAEEAGDSAMVARVARSPVAPWRLGYEGLPDFAMTAA